jgi:hypothetical protein
MSFDHSGLAHAGAGIEATRRIRAFVVSFSFGFVFWVSTSRLALHPWNPVINIGQHVPSAERMPVDGCDRCGIDTFQI